METDSTRPIRSILILKFIVSNILSVGAMILIAFAILFKAIPEAAALLYRPAIIAAIGALWLGSLMLFGLMRLIPARKNFHYAIGNTLSVQDYMGSQKEIAWTDIQSVKLKRDILDRLFGLATLEIKLLSASQYGKYFSYGVGNRGYSPIGFRYGRLRIPGLSNEDTHVLDALIRTKTQNNSPVQEASVLEHPLETWERLRGKDSQKS